MPNFAPTASRSALRWRLDLAHGLVFYFKQINSLARTIGVAVRVRGERRAMLALSEHILKDIGLDHGDVATESRRPLWDVPANRWRPSGL
jgi:uncharacterized protein YjiS (DUF1127 family)